MTRAAVENVLERETFYFYSVLYYCLCVSIYTSTGGKNDVGDSSDCKTLDFVKFQIPFSIFFKSHFRRYLPAASTLVLEPRRAG